MISEAQAREAVEHLLPDGAVVWTVEEHPTCWVVGFQSAEYVREYEAAADRERFEGTFNPSAYGGVCAYFVHKATGRVHPLPNYPSFPSPRGDDAQASREPWTVEYLAELYEDNLRAGRVAMPEGAAPGAARAWRRLHESRAKRRRPWWRFW